ncbi:MAG TPA: hypothetical protein H9902_00480 [Candidatus Stackebrandtia faecavium]|nr:hypothetical protein [Candidatus Stackebrandtia faecavium]
MSGLKLWLLPLLFVFGGASALLVSVVAANASQSTFAPTYSNRAVMVTVVVFALLAIIFFISGARGYLLSRWAGILQACLLLVGVHAYLAADQWFAPVSDTPDIAGVDRFAVYNPLVTTGACLIALSVVPFWWQFSKARRQVQLGRELRRSKERQHESIRETGSGRALLSRFAPLSLCYGTSTDHC